MSDYFQQIGISYGIFFLIGGIILTAFGMLIMRLVPSLRQTSNPFSFVLNAIFIGLTTVIPCFVIVWCKGNTIMWMAVLLWLYYFIKFPFCKMDGIGFWRMVKRILDWKTIVLLLFFYITVYCAFYHVFFVRGGGSFFSDFHYYGNAVVHIMETHSESSSFQGLYNQVSAYHYGELWLSAFAAIIFGLKPIYALLLFAYPVYAFLCLLGLASLCKTLTNTPNWVSAIAGFGGLFLTPLPSFINYGSYAAHPKNMVMASFFILGVSSFFDKNKMLALVAMLMSVPFYSPIAPGVLTFCFCFIVFEHLREGCGWKSFVDQNVFVVLLTVVFFLLFYIFQPPLPYSEPKEFLYEGNWLYNALTFFARRAGRFTIVMAIILIPSFFVLWKSKKDNWRVWIALFLCWYVSVLASCAIAGIMKQITRDGGQIYVNYLLVTTIVVYYSVALYLCTLMMEKLKPIFLSILILLVSSSSIFILMHQKKNSFVYPVADKVSNEMRFDLLKDRFQEANPVFGSFYLKGERYYIDDELLMMPNVIPNGYFAPYDLSCLQVPKELPKVLDDSHARALYQFVQLQKQKGIFVSESQSIIDFLEEMNVEYLLVRDMSEIPQQYRNNVRLIIQFTGISIYQIIT